MSAKDDKPRYRLMEGALSALKTPTAPPAPTRLVTVTQPPTNDAQESTVKDAA